MSVAPIHSDNPAARALAVRHRFRLWEALPWLLCQGNCCGMWGQAVAQ